VMVLHDTSELRRLERMRQEFVANVSHELKTPLAVVKSCVETLLDGAVEDPVERGPFLHQISEQGERLSTLIHDLLSLARVEAGNEVLNPESLPIAEMVSACIDRHSARALAKHISLHVDANREPLSVWADEESLRQILDNLVDNAVKYTQDGGEIRVSWLGNNTEVILSVADNGPGIAERDLPRLFERFFRVDRARSRELGGTGLGLSIVKHLAHAQGGRVQVTSEVGRGSTFTIIMPRSTPA
jgi:two-component system, OmpR family, phosphate regulon sensor histidine kinase PhoR